MNYYLIQVIFELHRQNVDFSKIDWVDVIKAAKQLKKYNQSIPDRAKR